jgi:hypothetical protein
MCFQAIVVDLTLATGTCTLLQPAKAYKGEGSALYICVRAFTFPANQADSSTLYHVGLGLF